MSETRNRHYPIPDIGVRGEPKGHFLELLDAIDEDMETQVETIDANKRSIGELEDQMENAAPRLTYLEPTTAAITKYVETTGDDDEGDGTEALPYATVEHALEDIPGWPRPVIRHECKILVGAGVYASGWPASFAPIFEEGGSLAIVGVGTPEVVSGPHTVTGVADLGTGGQRVTVAAGGLGATDSLCGQWIMIATGGHVAEAHRVAANTDTTIDLVLVTNKVDNADTFNLVNPAVKIASDGFDLLYDSRGLSTWDGEAFAPRNSRLILHNIWIDLSASPSAAETAILRGGQGRGGPTLDFVRIDLPATNYGGLVFDDLTLPPWLLPISMDYATDGETGIANLGPSQKAGLTIAGSGARDDTAIYTFGKTELTDVAVKGAISAYYGFIKCAGVTAGIFSALCSGKALLSKVLIAGKAATDAIEVQCPSIILVGVHICSGDDAIRLHNVCSVSLESVSCDPVAVTGSAMEVFVGCRIRQKGALASFVGASAGGDKAYTFLADTAVKSDTWHAANFASATDAKGAFITRLD